MLVGLKMTKADIKDLLKGVDADDSGLIDYNEFEKIMSDALLSKDNDSK